MLPSMPSYLGLFGRLHAEKGLGINFDNDAEGPVPCFMLNPGSRSANQFRLQSDAMTPQHALYPQIAAHVQVAERGDVGRTPT